MTPQQRKVMELALEAFKQINAAMPFPVGKSAITALEEALAQPEQEPVALEAVYETIIEWDEGGGKRSRRELARSIVSLYTTPPQRKLTDEQAHQTLLDMSKHIEEFGNEETTEEQLSGECVRFIIERVSAHSIKA